MPLMIKNSTKTVAVTVAVLKHITLPAQLINVLSQLFRSLNISLTQIAL